MGAKWKAKGQMVFLGAVLAMVLLRPPEAPATMQSSQTDVEIRTFWESSYRFCDARLLAMYWGEDVYSAKATIGRKVGWGDWETIENNLAGARQMAQARGIGRCSFAESEFTYEDAALLADVWGLLDPIEAKSRIEVALFNGQGQQVRDLLVEYSLELDPYDDPFFAEDPIQIFYDKGYTFCDARIMAAFWNPDGFLEPYEAKKSVGNMVLNGEIALVEDKLAYFRGQTQQDLNLGIQPSVACSYADDYAYEDVVALARAWQRQLGDVKAWVENKLFWGDNHLVQESLRRVGR